MVQVTQDQTILGTLFGAGEKTVSYALKAIDYAVEIGDIQANALQKAIEQQAQMGSALVHFGNQQYNLLSTQHDAESFVSLQAQLAKEFRDQWGRYVENLQKIGKDTSERYTSLVQKTVEKAAKQTVKAAA
ncbi:MAG: phasin family protein [Gammaproteobacteria bacterium]